MSSILEGLMGQLGGGALDGLSKQLGADRNQTQAGISAALPLLMGALARNAKGGDGADKLGAALDRDHDGSILEDVAGFMGKGDTSPGAGILKHVLGGRQSRVQNGLAQTTGKEARESMDFYGGVWNEETDYFNIGDSVCMCSHSRRA